MDAAHIIDQIEERDDLGDLEVDNVDVKLGETAKDMQTFEIRSNSNNNISRTSNGGADGGYLRVGKKKQSVSPSKTNSTGMNRSNYGSFKMPRRDSKMKSPLLLTKKEMGNRKLSKNHHHIM